MDFIWNRITDWLKEILVGGIMGNLQGLFDQVNTQVAGIAGQEMCIRDRNRIYVLIPGKEDAALA